jgi:hypothetical protein
MPAASPCAWDNPVELDLLAPHHHVPPDYQDAEYQGLTKAMHV